MLHSLTLQLDEYLRVALTTGTLSYAAVVAV